MVEKQGIASRRLVRPGLLTLTLALTAVVVTGTGAGSAGPGPRSAAVPEPVSAPAAAARPNVMVVMLDDMRSDEMRFAPNARKYIRDRGLDFRNAFSPYPLCCPARASFLLGKYAHNHHVLYHSAPYGFGSLDDSVTIATRLQDAGYDTAMVGKYLNKYGAQKSRVTGRSSQHYVPPGWTDWMAGLETNWAEGSGITGNTYNYFDYTQNINGRTVQNKGVYNAKLVGDQTRALISEYHRSAKPFFLWVTPLAPHHGAPFEAGDPGSFRVGGRTTKFMTPARPRWVKGRFDRVITHAPGQPRTGPAEEDVSDKPVFIRSTPEATPAQRRGLRDAERQRAEAIFAWDRQLGKIVQRLKQTGEYASTIIMFTSDNGFYVGEHRQRLGKITAYEPVIHVPLVVAGPGVPHGVRYTPITTFDLTATILQIAGAAALPQMDGTSRTGQLFGPDTGWTVPVVTEGLLTGVPRTAAGGDFPTGLTTSGIRTGRWKLVRYANGEGELYDLFADPNELRSRYADPRYAAVRAVLERLWLQYRECRAAQCRRPLPAVMSTSPQQLAAQWSHAARQRLAYYGR